MGDERMICLDKRRIRTSNSISSPTVDFRYPPQTLTVSLSNIPMAPEISSRPSSLFHAILPIRKALMYSSAWNRAHRFWGTLTLLTLPPDMFQELATRTTAPVAMTFFRVSCKNGRTNLRTASLLMRESTSMAIKRSLRQMLMSAFRASAFPPFSLSMISNFARAVFFDL